MHSKLREAWSQLIRAEDYEAHMVAVGQAEANAQLVAQYFATVPPKTDARILFLGAGTGQMFDFVSPEFLTPYQTTFADINRAYLRRLSERLGPSNQIRYVTVVDDVEQCALGMAFDLVIAVLVFEHIDWRKGVATACGVTAGRIFVVTQQNPESLAAAMTPQRDVPGTMNVFHEIHPELIPLPLLRDEFRSLGFRLAYEAAKTVADQKKMVASGFERWRQR
jgi:phospholipid N-methyltransferase